MIKKITSAQLISLFLNFRSYLAREFFPARENNVAIAGVELHQVGTSTKLFAGYHGGTAAAKWIQDNVSVTAGVGDLRTKQCHWLHRWMIVGSLRFIFIENGCSISSINKVSRRFSFPPIETRLMLPLVMTST